MNDLKSAAELALEAIDDMRIPAGKLTYKAVMAIAALKGAIKTQGEPVGVVNMACTGGIKWLRDDLPQKTKLYTSAPTIPAGYQLIRSDVVVFLNGSGELDGMFFGDVDTDKPRERYWWRKYLEYKGEQP